MSSPETNNEEPPQDDQDAEEQRRIYTRVQMSDPFIVSLVKESQGDSRKNPQRCAWCRVSVDAAEIYRCRDSRCREGLPACAACILVAHEPNPLHGIEIWTERRYWKPMLLRQLGYFMPASAQQRCFDDEERHLRRLASYRKYRRANLEDRREKTRRRMAELRERETAAERAVRRERHREAQRKYRERYREQIAHRARRAAVKRNEAEGKSTKLRPAARQYYSDPELITDDEEEEQDGW